MPTIESLTELVGRCLADGGGTHIKRLGRLFRQALQEKTEAMKTPYGKRRDVPGNCSSSLLFIAAILLEDTERYRAVREIISIEEREAYAFQRDELLLSRNTRGPIVSTDRIVGVIMNAYCKNKAFAARARNTIPREDLESIDREMVYLARLIGQSYFSGWSTKG